MPYSSEVVTELSEAIVDVGGEKALLVTGATAIGGTVTSGTVGSILFVGAGGLLAQDNANLFWDDTNNTIGFGTTRTGAISGTNPTVRIKGTGATSATSSFEVQNSAAGNIMFVRNDGLVGFGNVVSTYKSLSIDAAGNLTVGPYNIDTITPSQLIFGNWQSTGTTRPEFIFNGQNHWMGLGQMGTTGGDYLRLGSIAAPNVNWPTVAAYTPEFNLLIAGGLSLGTDTLASEAGMMLNGNAARIIQSDRHTTSNTAGNTVTIKAGGATVGATDKAGGDLILSPGLSTGSAESGVQINGCVAGVAGTADRTITKAIQVLGNKIAFFAQTPVVRQTELTDELTTITFSAPGTPDYAIADLTAITPYGFASADEGQTVLSVIANLQTRVNELETKLTAYGLLQDVD